MIFPNAVDIIFPIESIALDKSMASALVDGNHIIHHKRYRVKAYKRRAMSINQTQTWECILKPNYGTTKDVPPLDALRPGAIVIVLDPRR